MRNGNRGTKNRLRSGRPSLVGLFLGTYRDQPAEGHTGMTIGLSQFRDEGQADRLNWMLLLPFGGKTGDYPINRRGPESSARKPRSLKRSGTASGNSSLAVPRGCDGRLDPCRCREVRL